MTRILRLPFGAVLCLATLASPVVAQQPGPVWVEPRLGWSFSQGDLGRSDLLDSSGTMRFDEVEDVPALGMAVGVTVTSALAIRGFAERSLDADANGVWSCAPFIACPAVVLEVEGRLTRWSWGLDAMVDPGVVLATLRPRLVAGIGLRRYTMTWDDPVVAAFDIPVHRFESTDPVMRLGIDLSSRVGEGELFAGFEATGGRFGQGRLQFVEGTVPDGRETRVDLGLFAGVRWPLR